MEVELLLTHGVDLGARKPRQIRDRGVQGFTSRGPGSAAGPRRAARRPTIRDQSTANH